MSKTKVAKTIRIITIPPLLVATMLVLLFNFIPGIFRSITDLLVAIATLAIIPTLAYPLQRFIPGYKDGGRDAQRKLAFVSSMLGYTIGFVYALISGVSAELKFIFGTYFLSVIILILFNKVFHFKASGHACGVFGPLIHTVYFLGAGWMLPCAIAVWAVVWSSLKLMRHTKSELFFGGMTAATAFVFCAFLIL